MGHHKNYSFIILTLAFISLSNGQLKENPRYSLDNMPKTKFSCRDKILGGYYADPETQCQMFHVCVKVAGIGIQDFRFLCPNGTAFDQEAQICADWGDVDCEQATLYYGSDNFDLYRIGTGFDSKRASAAEEEEADFHLQRAETSDARRSKQFIVNQIVKTEKLSVKPIPARNIVVSPRPFQTTAPPSAQPFTKTEIPIIASTYRASPTSYYSPTPPQTIVVRNNYSPQPAFTREDDIFKGSHSSNFFNNRNGKDDDDFSHPNHFQVHPRPSTTGSPSTSSTPSITTTTQRPTAQSQTTKPRNRERGHIKAKATADPQFLAAYGIKKQEYQQFKPQQYSPTSQQYTTQPPQIADNRNIDIIRSKPKTFVELDKFNKPLKANRQERITSSTSDYKFQPFAENSVAPTGTVSTLKIEPKIYPSYNNIYNASLSGSSPAPFQKNNYVELTTTTFKPPTPFQINSLDKNSSQNRFYNTKYETTASDTYTTTTTTTVQPLGRSQLSSIAPIIDTKPSTYNPNNFIRAGSTLTAKNSEVRRAEEYRSRSTLAQTDTTTIGTQRFESQNKSQIVTARSSERYQTISRSQDNYTPSTAKKFSTLVPKELYNPTTFKPITHTIKRTDTLPLRQVEYKNFTPSTKTTTTTIAVTPPPLNEGDEDDGQYRPELYEKDLYKNKLKAKLAKTRNYYQTTSAPRFKGNDNDDDDELFNTAHSQNIAASGNELRAERARQAVKEINKIFESASKVSTTTRAPVKPVKNDDKDASYDYAYYDFGEHQNEFDTYGDIIEEFGKTKTKSKN